MKFEATIKEGTFTEACKLVQEAQHKLLKRYPEDYEAKIKSSLGAASPERIIFQNVPKEAIPALREHFKKVIDQIL
jgi:hypothetical protein